MLIIKATFTSLYITFFLVGNYLTFLSYRVSSGDTCVDSQTDMSARSGRRMSLSYEMGKIYDVLPVCDVHQHFMINAMAYLCQIL